MNSVQGYANLKITMIFFFIQWFNLWLKKKFYNNIHLYTIIFKLKNKLNKQVIRFKNKPEEKNDK